MALDRHRAIETALRASGPNPLPDELADVDWEESLTDFLQYGPLDCSLLQEAEARVKRLVEFLPEYWPDEEDEEGLGR